MSKDMEGAGMEGEHAHRRFEAGLQRVPLAHLHKIAKAVTAELHRRAKSSPKKPGEMNDAEFRKWAGDEVAKADTRKGGHYGE